MNKLKTIISCIWSSIIISLISIIGFGILSTMLSISKSIYIMLALLIISIVLGWKTRHVDIMGEY